MAQYEIHRYFSAGVDKTIETQVNDCVHDQWARSQHCPGVLCVGRSAPARRVQHVQLLYLTLPSSKHQFMTSQPGGSERSPCPRSPRC
jgi:hypothetical protein